MPKSTPLNSCPQSYPATSTSISNESPIWQSISSDLLLTLSHLTFTQCSLFFPDGRNSISCSVMPTPSLSVTFYRLTSDSFPLQGKQSQSSQSCTIWKFFLVCLKTDLCKQLKTYSVSLACLYKLAMHIKFVLARFNWIKCIHMGFLTRFLKTV